MFRRSRSTSSIAAAALVSSLAVHGGAFGAIYSAASETLAEEPPVFGAGRTVGETFEVSEYDAPGPGVGSSDVSGAAAAVANDSASEASGPDIAHDVSPKVLTVTTGIEKVAAKPDARKPLPVVAKKALQSATTATDATSRGSGDSGGGTFGSAGLEASLGFFPDSFTRVLPLAAQGLRGFYDASPGAMGKLLLRVSIGNDGKVVSILPKIEVPPHIQSLLRSSQILMRAGRFALPAGSRGDFLIGLSILVEQEAAPDEDVEPPTPTAVKSLSHSAPSVEKPGIALVRYASGRSITLKVFVDPDPKEY